MTQSVWDSDFGAIFKQRYDILADRDIKKGIGGGIGGVLGQGIGNAIAPGVGGMVGAGVGGGVGAEFDKAEKMEKETDVISGTKRKPLPPPPADLEENIAPYKSLRKAIRSIDRVLKDMTHSEQPVHKSDALRKSIKSVTKMLHKLDSCGGSTAGLNIKNVKAKKDGGGVFPAKTPPAPKQKKA